VPSCSHVLPKRGVTKGQKRGEDQSVYGIWGRIRSVVLIVFCVKSVRPSLPHPSAAGWSGVVGVGELAGLPRWLSALMADAFLFALVCPSATPFKRVRDGPVSSGHQVIGL